MDNASKLRSCNQCGCKCNEWSETISHRDVVNSHCTNNVLNNSIQGCDGQNRSDIRSPNLKEAYKRRVTENSGGKNTPEVKSKRTKRNLETYRKEDSKNKSPNSKQIMYHCEYCDTCSTHRGAKINDKLSHYNGKCMSFPAKFCLSCGLKFTNHTLKNHGTHHQRNNLDDFKFCRWQDEKPLTNPPIPRYPFCAKCKVYFIPSPEDEHNCSVMEKKKEKTCVLCDKTYDDKAYEVHLKFHNGSVTLSSDDDVKLKDSLADTQETDRVASKKAEDIKCGVKRETVVNFFRCKTCTAAYHIKGYAERHKCGMSLRYCLICQLYIPEIHYKKHAEFHDKLGNIEFRRQIKEF